MDEEGSSSGEMKSRVRNCAVSRKYRECARNGMAVNFDEITMDGYQDLKD